LKIGVFPKRAQLCRISMDAILSLETIVYF
jgi:hypothetical protein